MEKNYNIIQEDHVQCILELLEERAMTKEELVLQMHLPEFLLYDTLNELLKNEWILKKDGAYYINVEVFQEAAFSFFKFCGKQQEIEKKKDEAYHIDVNESLCDHFFRNREQEFHYAAFDREISFYDSICSGNIETVKTLFTDLGGEGFGTLSKDPLQNLKYHLVISIAMITRFCINSGMPHEEAYSLSDVYIIKTDCCRSKSDIHKLHYEMTIDFTKRMRQIKNGVVYSKPILLALDYISDHLHDRILIEELADYLSLSVPYLSRLFKSEVGMPFSQYIIIKKVEAAASMLQFSDYSALDISNYFAFSSHSYFIKVFKKHIGMTPKEYRSKYYAIGWMNNKITR